MRPSFLATRRNSRLWGAIALTIVFSAAVPATARAALGDCGQPVSAGPGPVATDCLFILQAAVGTQACDPSCICDLNATGGDPNATDALACLNASVGVAGLLNCDCEPPASTEGDDFNDNSKDPAKWGSRISSGNGLLSETSQRLEYRCNNGTEYDEEYWPWIKSELPYDADWEAQIDLVNLTEPSAFDQVNSFGIEFVSPDNFDDYIFVEMYSSALQGPPARIGFYGEIGFNFAFVDSGERPTTVGAVRLAFDAGTKVATLFYDDDPGDGYQWTAFGSFGIAGSGGADGNADWALSAGARMPLLVYGFSQNMRVEGGAMWGDNFSVTGAVGAALTGAVGEEAR